MGNRNLIDDETYEMVKPQDAEDAKATASQYGLVKPSDDYTATGTAADGLVPSQKALSDGLNDSAEDILSYVNSQFEDLDADVKISLNDLQESVDALQNLLAVANITNNVNWLTTGGATHGYNSAYRFGKIVEVNTSLITGSATGNVISGLPIPASGGFYFDIKAADGTNCDFQMTSAGEIKYLSGASTKTCIIHLTYITSN